MHDDGYEGESSENGNLEFGVVKMLREWDMEMNTEPS